MYKPAREQGRHSQVERIALAHARPAQNLAVGDGAAEFNLFAV